ncbi:MAG TPA: T9SS type A sorting domain-containing protein [candidate division Zixibacteria bacterium]|mgnify:CR=1 FL=1|nr:T9SS type A sorting domain-containing protein [candidate division Zixibacteria bacterium]
MRIVILILLIAAVTQGEWSFSLTIESVCDTAVEQELIIGTHPECGAGFDLGWDVMRPPYPPAGALAYLYIDDPANPGIDGLLTDIRSDSQIHLLWRIHYYTNLCGTIGDSCKLSWNPDSLPDGTFKIIPSLEDTGWRAPTIDWSEALDMSAHSSLPPFWISHMAYISYTSPLAVRERDDLPEEISVRAFPNPFNSSIMISFDYESDSAKPLSRPLLAGVEIYDVAGRRVSVAKLVESTSEITRDGYAANSRSIYIWEPAQSLPSGIYFAKGVMACGATFAPKRIVYLK